MAPTIEEIHVRHSVKRLLEGTEITFNDNPRYVVFRHYGLDSSLYTRHSQARIENVMRLAVQVRVLGMLGDISGENTSCFDIRDLTKKTNSTIFVAATDFEFTREMHNPLVRKTEFDVKVSLGNIGKFSLTMLIEFFLPGTVAQCKPILRHTKRMVFANVSTRRPIEIPKWFKEPLDGKGIIENTDFRVNRFERPKKTFYKCSEILFADTDINSHMNYSGCPRKAVEAMHCYFFYCNKMSERLEAAQVSDHEDKTPRLWGGDLSAIHNVTEKDLRNGLKHIKICYLKEGIEGDMVYTHLWQEIDSGKEVKCSIEKADGTVLCQLTLEYFSPLVAL